ncbi:MAG: Stp1/IreP family PP2C-type Ser/Thr phosphatase, partial [Bacteroidales bacterium]|nr:Stp1/IreP family PP2C-type Ser/Thr phosphatase [Bacteroidales bacterium]
MVRTVSLKNFDLASITDKGRVRERNEDFLAYFDTLNGHVFVVCDGMGGHNAGDVASELAVESVGNYFNQKYYSNPFEAVENAINYANKAVYNHANGNDYLNGMGTTIVLLLIRDDRIYYGHAGDSRLYLFKNNILYQLTVDHSRVQELLNSGRISQKEALDHPLRNEITRALGLSMRFEPEVSPKAIIPEDNDLVMICTDGLTNMLRDEEIVKCLSNLLNLNDKAARLVSRANKNGGLDNISVQLIKFHNLGAY